MARESGGRARVDELHALGRLAGSAEAIGWGVEANRHPPELRTFDRFGHRIDEVAFHPAYHRLLEVAVTSGWRAPPGPRGTPAVTSSGPPASSCGARSTPASAARRP